MTPVCMTWEQIVPPYVESPGGLFGEGTIARSVVRIQPVGEGEPFCGKYRLHDGRYHEDEKLNKAHIEHNGDSLVVTFEGKKVGVLSGLALWIDAEHRYSVTKIDLAVELWMAHGIKRGLDKPVPQHLTRDGKPIPMTKATLKVAKRAYLILVERGYVMMPEGYTPPFPPF